METATATATAIIRREDERLTDDKDRLIGWIASDGKFHPCGASITADQLRAILAMLAK